MSERRRIQRRRDRSDQRILDGATEYRLGCGAWLVMVAATLSLGVALWGVATWLLGRW